MTRIGIAAAMTGGAAVMLLVAACDGGHSPAAEPPALPELSFWLRARAETTADSFTVTCALDYIVEIAGEVSRSNEVVEYVGTMGGEASRTILAADQSGVSFVADAFSEIQVLLFVPDRVQIDLINVPPNPPGVVSRFWDEQHRFEGVLAGNTIEGEWTCAPLDTEIGGINDDSIFAVGAWFTEPVPAQ